MRVSCIFTALVYFITKGCVKFTLSHEYEFMEIREVKKQNNFGEIEMCLNSTLSYDIKIKSRNCELFVLKKDVKLEIKIGLFESFNEV
jgi:hypothetical protein